MTASQDPSCTHCIVRSKLFLSGCILIVLGIACNIAERIFYGGIDENGVLQESFFLPLSFILAFIGLVGVVISVFIRLFARRS